MSSKIPSVLIVAAEASSSLYAQRLLEFWQKEDRPVHAFGIGSRTMESLGFEILGRSEELAVVGLQEVLSHFSQIRSTFFTLLNEAKKRRPKFALLLDYPDFNLRLAKRLKKIGIPVIFYISPQVWAWRTSRVYKIKKCVDRMLVLFPFEKVFYDKYGVPVEFVGHPLLDELSDRFFNRQEFFEQRSKYGIEPHQLLLALMPGSRRSEIKHHLITQVKTAEILAKKFSHLEVALLVAPTFQLEEIRRLLPNSQLSLRLIRDEPFHMIRLADVVLCASGTATLMVGLLEKPMVIMYRMTSLTAFLAKRFVTATKYFGLINLVLDTPAVPELFQERANETRLAQELTKFIESETERAQTAKVLSQTRHLLGDRGATVRVAHVLQKYFEAP